MGEIGQLAATADALRRRRPDLLARLAQDHPDLGLAITLQRPLGSGEEIAPKRGGTQALAEVAMAEAKEDLSDLLDFLARRTRLLGRIRLLIGISSAVASASVVGLLIGEGRGTTLAAVVAFTTTLIGLVMSYIEDFSGGSGSTAKLRDAMLRELRRLVEARSELAIGIATDDDAKIVAALKLVNEVFGEVQAARGQLGLPV